MNVKFYTNKSADNVVTKDIIEIASFDGYLREGCSVVDPVIKFENFNRALVNQLNYVMIPQFGRYYFVRDIRFEGNLTVITMHVDVVSSWQTQLKSLNAIISRQEKKHNLYLQDGIFRTYSNPHISILPFPDGFTDFQYIFTVAG